MWYFQAYSIYVENILDVFVLSHFVFSCHLLLHIYLLMCGWEVLFCFMSFICESILLSDWSGHLLSEKEPKRNSSSSIKSIENDVSMHLICNWCLSEVSQPHFSYSTQCVTEIAFYSPFRVLLSGPDPLILTENSLNTFVYCEYIFEY